jgi:hypothetical protein
MIPEFYTALRFSIIIAATQILRFSPLGVGGWFNPRLLALIGSRAGENNPHPTLSRERERALEGDDRVGCDVVSDARSAARRGGSGRW